jgi:nitrogen-specific signal transduction histidine kinase
MPTRFGICAVQYLQRVSALELQAAPGQNAAVVELKTVLDEFRVLIENAYRELGIQIVGQVAEPLPLVWADRYGLVQVFLNLAKNSEHAMLATKTKRLCVKRRKKIAGSLSASKILASGSPPRKICSDPFSAVLMLVGWGFMCRVR